MVGIGVDKGIRVEIVLAGAIEEYRGAGEWWGVEVVVGETVVDAADVGVIDEEGKIGVNVGLSKKVSSSST